MKNKSNSFSPLAKRENKKLLLMMKLMVLILAITVFQVAGSFYLVNQPQRQVTGQVTDALTGEPIPGVNVFIKGTIIGSITDLNGNYSVGVPADARILVFSFIGMKTQDVDITDKILVNVIMEEEAFGLEEVVAIGYGTRRRSDLTGSVIRADIASFRESPNISIMQSLQGSVPGLTVGQVNQAGQEPNILIRGKTSLSGELRPLIVVDNVIFRGNIIDLNPNDIESVDILKDASAAAIYGSQATNGVILITTTRSGGIDGKPLLNYSSSYSFQRPAKEFFPPDTAGFYKKTEESDIFHSRTAASGYLEKNPTWLITGVFSTSEEIAAYNDGRITDWHSMLTNQNMYAHNHNLSLSNNTKYNNYLMSIGYTEQLGYMLNEDYNRLNARINMDNKVTQWLKIGVQSFMTASDYSGQDANPIHRYSSPYAAAYDENGELIQIVRGNVINPLIQAEADHLDKRLNLFGNLYADLEIPYIKGLTYRINFANNYRTTSEYYFRSYGSSFQGQGSKREDLGYDWSTDNILTYKRLFKDIHNIDVTLVYGVEKRKYNWTSATASVFDSHELGYNRLQSGSADLQLAQSGAWEEASLYSMGRLFYGLNNKYLFTGTIRRDGFSGFSEQHKFGLFPSMSFAWVISEEDFYNKDFVFDYLKMRASYGSVGNRTIGRYQTLARVSGGFNYVTMEHIPVFTQSTTTLASPNLKWETTTGINLGLDFGLLKQRLFGSFDYYNNNTTDLLYDVDLPGISRFEKFPDNLGKLHNQGLELTLTSINLKSKDLEWMSTFNFSRNRNTLKELLGFDFDGDGKEDDLISEGLFIGESIDAIYDYRIDGKWQVGDVIQSGFDLGTHKPVDLTGDGTISHNDKTIIGYRDPAYSFSINNSLRYKKWRLKFFVNSIQGGKNYYLSEDTYKSFSIMNSQIHFRVTFPEGIDYWTPENPGARYQRPNISVSSGLEGKLYAPRNFIRLQDVSLSYDVPASLIHQIRLNNLRLYFSGKNLLTLTKWNGWDPETGQTILMGGRPVIKSYSFGLNVEF